MESQWDWAPQNLQDHKGSGQDNSWLHTGPIFLLPVLGVETNLRSLKPLGSFDRFLVGFSSFSSVTAFGAMFHWFFAVFSVVPFILMQCFCRVLQD